MSVSFSYADVTPYTVLDKVSNVHMQCLSNRYLIKTHPKDMLINIEMISSEAIKKLFEQDIPALDIYKAFVLDYYYGDESAKKHYERASESSKKNMLYYINYLIRTYDYEVGVKKIKALSIFSNTGEFDKLSAFIYMAHNKKIHHRVISSLKRRNITTADLEREFYGCKKERD